MKKSRKIRTNKLSDSEILHRSHNEPWLFGMLVSRYQKPFLRKSKAILSSAELSEDAVQDTFLKIYKNTSYFQETSKGSFNSWAYKILLNTCYTYYAKQKRESAYLSYMNYHDLDVLDTGGYTSAISDKHSFMETILTKMPINIARLLRLYFLEGKNQKEIANLEHISPGAVRVRMYRAKKYIKANFESTGSIQNLISL